VNSADPVSAPGASGGQEFTSDVATGQARPPRRTAPAGQLLQTAVWHGVSAVPAPRWHASTC